jgi:hypothetical protein
MPSSIVTAVRSEAIITRVLISSKHAGRGRKCCRVLWSPNPALNRKRNLVKGKSRDFGNKTPENVREPVFSLGTHLTHSLAPTASTWVQEVLAAWSDHVFLRVSQVSPQSRNGAISASGREMRCRLSLCASCLWVIKRVCVRQWRSA